MKQYAIEIVGKTPLLMHWDNIEWADEMERWKNNPANKTKSKAGDDRSPAFRWLGSLYHDGTHVAIPSDNLMRCMMEGGAMVPTGGRAGKTFKAQTQSGCMVGEPFWPLVVKGKMLDYAPLFKALREEPDFDRHQAFAAKNGFLLYLKRAKIGTSKHIRVRPRFDSWAASGTLNVWDDQLTENALRQIWTYAGQYKGLGDWRPGGKTPGSYGMFEVTLRAVS